MVNFASFVTTAALLSSFSWVTALPQSGSSSYGSGWSQNSNSNGMNAPPSNMGSSNSNSGYESSNSGYDSSNSNYGSNSGYGSSNSGYGSSNSGYGSSNSGYGSSNSGYGSSNSGYDSSNQDGYGLTTTTTMTSSSTMSTETAYTTSVMYGSGSMNSGSDSYNNCVAQCMASFPPPPPTSTYVSNSTYSSSGTYGSSSNSGNGATKTVIVAPTQGVLRYIPFAINASVGDTIMFVWGANNHTVTKGSALEPCNATQDALFTTAQENKGFTFTQVVNSTDPVFFHCATPGHCPKGMFGVINPPSNLDAPTSVSGMMQSLTAQNTVLNAYAAMTDNATSGSPGSLWGGNIDMSSIPTWAHSLVAENVLYTRNLIAMNPEILKEDGSIDMSSVPTTPLMYPSNVQDDASQDAAASTTSSSSSPSPTSVASAVSAAGAASTNSPATPPNTNGASSTGPKALALLVVSLATVLAL